jgi:hypothetical protein
VATRRIDLILAASRAKHRRRARLGGNVRTLDFPRVEEWTSNHLARVLIALLEKAPQPLSELSARTRLPVSKLIEALRAARSQFGYDLQLYSLVEKKQASLESVLSGEVPDFVLSSVGISDGPESRIAIAEHCYNACLEYALADREAVAAE